MIICDNSYCRYIKDNETVGEFQVKNGSNHKERIKVADENKIDFDYYLIFYANRISNNNQFKYYADLNKNETIGTDKSSRNYSVFNMDSNKIEKQYLIKVDYD